MAAMSAEYLEALQALQKRLEAVEKQLEGIRSLRLEWEDVYERVNRAVARLNQRARAEAGKADDAPGATNETPAGGRPSQAELLRLARARDAARR